VDLIKSQIRIAAGEKLADAVGPVEFRGHSIECRVNAEDPVTFVPSAGRITTFQMPGGTGVRVDTAAHADAVIPPYYDSLIAKLIVHGRDRSEAIARMRRALEMFVVEGVKTSLPLHQRIFAEPISRWPAEHPFPRRLLPVSASNRPRRCPSSSATLCNTRCGLAQYVGPFLRQIDGRIRG